MKHPSAIDEDNRFRGGLRHYHRSDSQPLRTWDEWVDGKQRGPRSSGKWLKVGVVAAAVIAIVSIFAGLVIVLW